MIAHILMAALMVGPSHDDSHAQSPAAGLRGDTTVVLRDVNVSARRQRDFQMKTSQTAVSIGHDYLRQHFAGSLMQTLEGIPGVKAMAIGSGQSKPAIRGLGFNRMVVAEDGIKHEGQQWGDDHGLEIDQFAIDRAEVIKGPAALLYGSDAIGGVLSLYTNHVPTEPFAGSVQLLARSGNEQLGLSAKVGGRRGRFFYRANATFIDYADYSVPTDSIQYYSYWIKLHKGRLRNTAGCERDGSLMVGYAGYNFHTDLRLSDSYSKSGFFADAHGLEVRLSDIPYDRSRRDIDLPYQWVNHLKVLSHTTWRNDATAIEMNLAYQRNLREERSEPVSHGYMPLPPDPLERRFDKNTATATLALRQNLGERHELSAGLSAERQVNKRSGWGFIIPDFNVGSAGAYAMDRLTLREGLVVNAGLRFDLARTHIRPYSDWFPSPVTTADGQQAMAPKQRATDLTRHFRSLTWSVGLNHSAGPWVMKANAGKSFRIPIPKELGANGVNYHIFRYEQGNADLDPEESYQLDAAIHWNNGALELQLEPYLNFFPNYIYLSPTASYVEGLQLYHYTQARVLRYGCEAQATWHIDRHWTATAQGEYLYARQQSGEKKGYTLPFSTPWSADATLQYQFRWHGDASLALNAHVVGAQHDIVPPEKPTDGYFTLNATASKRFHLGNDVQMHASLNANNLLNRRYYDHTSFYRLIDVPEPGRNIALMLEVEF